MGKLDKEVLVAVAEEAQEAVRAGVLPGGASIAEATARACASTVLVSGEELAVVDAPGWAPPAGPRAGLVEVTPETTNDAAERLAHHDRVALLNFASARNPGGGFLTGARAQEECLCRTSALYACLTQPQVAAYFAANRAERSCLYRHDLVYTPAVPFFRRANYDWLEAPYLVDVLTAPAPNRGAIESNTPGDLVQLEATFRSRIRRVLEVFRRNDARTIILGAWGCGAFRNDPREVAAWFRDELQPFRSHFDRIVFAVYDPKGDGRNLRPFRDALGDTR